MPRSITWKYLYEPSRLINLAELFQEARNRHFAISRTDFRNSFYVLKADLLRNGFDCLTLLTLSYVLTKILRHESVYFNDKGEFGHCAPEPATGN